MRRQRPEADRFESDAKSRQGLAVAGRQKKSEQMRSLRVAPEAFEGLSQPYLLAVSLRSVSAHTLASGGSLFLMKAVLISALRSAASACKGSPCKTGFQYADVPAVGIDQSCPKFGQSEAEGVDAAFCRLVPDA